MRRRPPPSTLRSCAAFSCPCPCPCSCPGLCPAPRWRVQFYKAFGKDMTFIPPAVSKTIAAVVDWLVYLTRGRIAPYLGEGTRGGPAEARTWRQEGRVAVCLATGAALLRRAIFCSAKLIFPSRFPVGKLRPSTLRLATTPACFDCTKAYNEIGYGRHCGRDATTVWSGAIFFDVCGCGRFSHPCAAVVCRYRVIVSQRKGSELTVEHAKQELEQSRR